MNKQFENKYMLLFPLFLMLAACDHDENGSDEPLLPENAIEIKAKVDIESDGSAVDFNWEADADRIGLFTFIGSEPDLVNVYLAAYSSTAQSSFVAPSKANTLSWKDSQGATDFYAYYPFRTSYTDPEAIPVSVPAVQNGDSVKVKNLMLIASDEGVTNGSQVSFTFKPVVSVIKLSVASSRRFRNVSEIKIIDHSGSGIAFGDGTVNLLTGEVKSDSSFTTISLKFTSPITISSKKQTWWIPIAPGHAGDSFEISIVRDGTESTLASFTAPDAGFPAGTVTTVDISTQLQPANAKDLSVSGTANTYIVNAAGTTYKFKANVKGNGESRSFSWNYEQSSRSASISDVSLSPYDALLVWYNTPKQSSGFVNACPIDTTSLYYSEGDGYVYFNTPEEFVDGNALVAVTDESGTILWSWNIWAVEGYDPDATAKSIPGYVMMDRNLGAMRGYDASSDADPTTSAWAIGNYYQWGRKDPFPAATEYNSASNELDGGMQWGLPTHTPIESLKNDRSSYSWGDKDLIFTEDRAANGEMLQNELGAGYTVEAAVQESIEKPYKWMFNGTSDGSNPYMWMTNDILSKDLEEQSDWKYLWGDVEELTSSEKTIYDPCPPGWKVPTADALEFALDGTELASGGHGIYSSKYAIYFPFAGQRRAGFGGSQITELTTSVQLWSSSVATPFYPMKGTKVNSNGTISGASACAFNSYAGAAYQVRCVREEKVEMSKPIGEGSGEKADLFGDSITEQWPIRGRKAFFTDNGYVCEGISGQTSMNLLARFYSDVLSHDPQVLVIAVGTNDLADNNGYHKSIEDIAYTVELMADIAHDYGAEIIIGAALPTDNMWWKNDAWNEEYGGEALTARIIAYNSLLKAFAEKRGYLFADYWSQMHDDNNALKEEYRWQFSDGTLDSVHPNAAGYLVMEGVLKPLIDEALSDPDQVGGGGDADDFGDWTWN
jgi:lysophospholipase L1-like esterase